MRLTDADARGPNIYAVAVSAPQGGRGEFALVGRNIFGYSVGSVDRGSTVADSDVIRIALETGRGHSGTGVIVYDREVAGGTREVLLSLLICNQDSDCFDNDDTTPDLCVGAGVNARCVRAMGDAGVDAATDVPTAVIGDGAELGDASEEGDSGPLSDATVDRVNPPIDGVESDVPPLRDTSASPDVTVTLDDVPQPPSVQVAYGGGSCACRVGARVGDRSAKLLALAWIAAVVVLRNRRTHFSKQRRVRTC